jgi:hypothetical protein
VTTRKGGQRSPIPTRRRSTRSALLDDRLASELRARSLHPSQRVEHGAHGRPHLVMTVRRTDEVASWAMSVAPSAEILRPATLRDEVARRLAAASARYARGDAA